MAQSKCPNCGNKVSNQASFCSDCGARIDKSEIILTGKSPRVKEDFEIPEKSEDLRIGKQITNWAFDSAIEGYYDHNENPITKIPQGRVTVTLHSHGIQILGGALTINKAVFYPIHNSQIIGLYRVSRDEVSEIFPGLSRDFYFMIDYWDFETTSVQTIFIYPDKPNRIDAFIRRQEKEDYINRTENRLPEKDNVFVFGVIAIIVILICVFYIIYTLIFQ